MICQLLPRAHPSHPTQLHLLILDGLEAWNMTPRGRSSPSQNLRFSAKGLTSKCGTGPPPPALPRRPLRPHPHRTSYYDHATHFPRLSTDAKYPSRSLFRRKGPCFLGIPGSLREGTRPPAPSTPPPIDSPLSLAAPYRESPRRIPQSLARLRGFADQSEFLSLELG